MLSTVVTTYYVHAQYFVHPISGAVPPPASATRQAQQHLCNTAYPSLADSGACVISASDPNLAPLRNRSTAALRAQPPSPTSDSDGWFSDEPDTPTHRDQGGGVLAAAWFKARTRKSRRKQFWCIALLVLLTVGLGIAAGVTCAATKRARAHAAAHSHVQLGWGVPPLRITSASVVQTTRHDVQHLASFLVVGGWGRQGSLTQQNVAGAMQVAAADNFIGRQCAGWWCGTCVLYAESMCRQG